MDNIDEIMKEADRLGFGVSYGKYRAAFPGSSGEVISEPTGFRPYEKPSRACANCGTQFIPRHYNQLYCCADCRDAVRRKWDLEHKKKKARTLPVIACEICGADFKPKRRGCKYCCKECAEDGKRKKSAAWHAAQKKDG